MRNLQLRLENVPIRGTDEAAGILVKVTLYEIFSQI
jgi:hypothetical protein